MIENTENTQVETLPIVISDDSVAKINVLAEEHELDPYKKQYLKEKKKHVVIRGFRKGMAPEDMVARFFKDEARQSARDNVIYVKYMKLLQDHKLQPLTEPKIEGIVDENGKIDAKLSVEVLQPVVLGQYLGLELQEFPQKSIDDGINVSLIDMKKAYPKLIEVDVLAEKENVVVVDFTMTANNEEIEKQENFKVSLGVNLYFPEFEAQLLGTKAGDVKEFDIHFPEDYQNEQLKNKDVHFNLVVKSVQNVSSYTDEELSVLLGYASSEKMIEVLTNELESKYKNEEHLYYENQLLGQLLSAHQFKLPRTLIESEVARIVVEKPELEKTKAIEVADRFVRTDLVLHAIYERHPDIHFTKEEFDAKLGELAARANDTIEGTLQKLQSAGKLQSYVNYLNNCRVIDFLIEMADKKPAFVVNEDNNTIELTE